MTNNNLQEERENFQNPLDNYLRQAEEERKEHILMTLKNKL